MTSNAKRVLAAYEAAGWSRVRKGANHWVYRCPHGCCQTSLSGTTIGERTAKNDLARIRRCPGLLTGEVHSGH